MHACGLGGILIEPDMKRAGCGHSFHAAGCFDLATDQKCIECIANRNMTNYQNCFAEKA